MAYLIVLIILIVGAGHLMREKIGFTKQNIDHMWIGILGFGGLESLAKILVGLFSGLAGSMLLTYLISCLISFGFAYFLYTRL